MLSQEIITFKILIKMKFWFVSIINCYSKLYNNYYILIINIKKYVEDVNKKFKNPLNDEYNRAPKGGLLYLNSELIQK
jgi:hypothetical protein